MKNKKALFIILSMALISLSVMIYLGKCKKISDCKKPGQERMNQQENLNQSEIKTSSNMINSSETRNIEKIDDFSQLLLKELNIQTQNCSKNAKQPCGNNN